MPPVTLTTVHRGQEKLTTAVGDLDKNISVFIASQIEINKNLTERVGVQKDDFTERFSDQKDALRATREELELVKRKVWAYPSASLVGSIAAIVMAVRK